MYNHESPRRGSQFVTKKIISSAVRIKSGLQKELYLGNLDAQRDWGYAPDYVKAMWLMLQQDKPDDYVLATGETRTVRDFVRVAFDHAGMPITFEGQGVDEVGKDEYGVVRVKVNPKFYRPAEVELLIGDPTKAERELGWEREFDFEALVKDMMDE